MQSGRVVTEEGKANRWSSERRGITCNKEEQMKYLRSKKYKIDRMECFMSLVELAGRETKLVQISKVQQVVFSLGFAAWLGQKTDLFTNL